MKPNYFIIPLITVVLAALGSWFTSSGIESGWYDGISKPSWTPPGSVIGAVWTVLFILATISALIVWNKAPVGQRRTLIVKVFILNILLNLAWSFLFFSQHLVGSAVVDSALLGASVLWLIILIRPVSHFASLLLWPYFLWVAFATFLNYTIWRIT